MQPLGGAGVLVSSVGVARSLPGTIFERNHNKPLKEIEEEHHEDL